MSDRTPAGHEGARECVGALLRRDDGRVLLARRVARAAWYPDAWDMVGGHVEPGERTEDALVREIREELGVTALGWRRGGSFRLHDGHAAVLLHVYVVTRWAGVPTNAEPAEHRAVAWVTAERACRLRLADPALCDLLRRLSA